MNISLIAAVARNGVIGTGEGGIPWKLPRDSRHFRESVAGRHMLLGRKTFEEMIGWFQTERPMVITRDSSYAREDATVVRSVEEAIAVATEAGETELMVSGGASVYAMTLPYADRMALTHVDAEIEGGARFPGFDPKDWRVVREEPHAADAENAYPMRFVWYERLS